MEQSVERKSEDLQAPSGDDDASGMSVITIESTSPASVRSVTSSMEDVDDYMVDVDDNEKAASCENDAAHVKPPILDINVVQCSDGKEEMSAEPDVPALSENICASEIDSRVTDDIDKHDSSLDERASSSPENPKDNSDLASFPIAESSNKCDDGTEVDSGNTTTLESGSCLMLTDQIVILCQPFSYFRSQLCDFS